MRQQFTLRWIRDNKPVALLGFQGHQYKLIINHNSANHNTTCALDCELLFNVKSQTVRAVPRDTKVEILRGTMYEGGKVSKQMTTACKVMNEDNEALSMLGTQQPHLSPQLIYIIQQGELSTLYTAIEQIKHFVSRNPEATECEVFALPACVETWLTLHGFRVCRTFDNLVPNDVFYPPYKRVQKGARISWAENRE